MKRTMQWIMVLAILGYGVTMYATDIIQPINITQTSACNGLTVQPACVPGGVITLSTFTATGGFCFADGTCQTTAAATPTDVAYTDHVNTFTANQVFSTGTAASPSVAIGEPQTGFYNSGSHQVTFTSNGSARLDLIANGIGNPNTSDSAGVFFSGADTNLNCGGGGALIKFQEGNTGYLLMQLNAGTKQDTIPAAGGLSVTYNVTVGSLTVTGAGAPPDSQALCLLSGKLGHCTTVVGVTGGCTCSVP